VWRYRWAVTLTVRELNDDTMVSEEHLVIDSVDDLVDLVLHRSLDPRIAAYSYHRFAALDMSAAPAVCPRCGEPYIELTPGRSWQQWRQCSCGGHAILVCHACGTDHAYPRLEHDCTDRATLPGSATAIPAHSPPKRRRARATNLWRRVRPST
jgi:hypothetical protein